MYERVCARVSSEAVLYHSHSKEGVKTLIL